MCRKSLWNIIKMIFREDRFQHHFSDHDFCVWAFGEGYKCLSEIGLKESWSSIHSDIFTVTSTDNIILYVDQMYCEYLNFKEQNARQKP